MTEVLNESNTYQIEMPLYKGEQFRFSNKTLTWQTTSLPKDTTDFKVGASGNPEVVKDGTYTFKVNTKTSEITYERGASFLVAGKAFQYQSTVAYV